ncbi:MAG: hypothetical protein ACO306_01210 [Flavobacteriaceae bacterium]
MKNLVFNCLLLLTALPIWWHTRVDNNPKYEKTKTYQRNFDVAPNALLLLDNRYGSIEVVESKTAKVSIDVVVRVWGNQMSSIEDKLDEIFLDITGSKTRVSAVTSIGNTQWNWSFWKNNSISYEINYVVHAPATMIMEVSQKYGDITVARSTNALKIVCAYGNIELGQISGEATRIEIDYANNSHIEKISQAQIDADYSNLVIGSSSYLNLHTDYSDISLKQVKKVDLDMDYCQLNIDSATAVHGSTDYVDVQMGTIGQFNLDMDYGDLSVKQLISSGAFSKLTTSYTDVAIDQLNSSLALDMQYGQLDIDHWSGPTGQLDIETQYTDISIYYEPLFSFSTALSGSYITPKGLANLESTKRIEKSNSFTFEGYYKQLVEKKQLFINARYGSIQLNNSSL